MERREAGPNGAADSPVTWVRMGAAFSERSDSARAGAAFARAIALAPDDARCPFNMGVVLHRQGRLKEAVAAYRRAQQLDPSLDALSVNLSHALQALGRSDQARLVLRHRLAWAPTSPGALNALALAERRIGSVAAEQLLRRALVSDRAHGDARHNLAVLLQDTGRAAEAFELYREAIRGGIGQPGMYVNIGVMEQSAGRSAMAAFLYRAALEREPDNVTARINLTAALLEEGEPEAAVEHGRAALALLPTATETLWNLSCAQLMLGAFDKGFRHYDRRWRQPHPDLRQHVFPFPLWDGRPLPHGRLLLWGEHGIGDEILYAGLLGAVMERAPATVVECDSRLVPLFSRSFPGATVVGRSTPPAPATQTPAVTAQSSTLRLPALFHGANQRPAKGYLRAAPEQVEEARAALSRLGPGAKIGISWTSRNAQTAGRKATRLAQWRSILATADAQFVSLQYGDVDDEIESLRADGVRNLHRNPNPDLMRDLDGLAAQIAGLDLVISIAGVTAHLAGALGRPCWVLLPPGPLWFWGVRGEAMPWYPSMRLFRKGRTEDWAACLEAVASALPGWQRLPL